MAVKVYVTAIENRHGTFIEVFSTVFKRNLYLYGYVRENWERLWVEQDIELLTQEEAIDFYFENNDDEYLWKEKKEIL